MLPVHRRRCLTVGQLPSQHRIAQIDKSPPPGFRRNFHHHFPQHGGAHLVSGRGGGLINLRMIVIVNCLHRHVLDRVAIPVIAARQVSVDAAYVLVGIPVERNDRLGNGSRGLSRGINHVLHVTAIRQIAVRIVLPHRIAEIRKLLRRQEERKPSWSELTIHFKELCSNLRTHSLGLLSHEYSFVRWFQLT